MLIKQLFKREEGTVIVIVALMLTVLFGFVALATDVGVAYSKKTKLQYAIDATALAAAQELPNTTNATNVANQYIQLNGFTPSDISISFSDSNRTINIQANKTVNLFFAKVLGFNSVNVHPLCSASSESVPAAFNYALFSGSTTSALTLNGSSQYISGSSHANKNFSANGSNLTITGACEAVTTITVNGSQINIDNRVPNSSFVAMPDFSDSIKTLAQQNGHYYTGNQTYNGSNLDISNPIYVEGNVTVNGSHFTGKGTIVATGTITFNGSNLNASGNDAVCFYSQSGNITVNGSGSVFDGILYAPNGTITMNGSSQTVNGRVIGNKVTINGSSLRIISGSNELSSLSTSGVKLIR